MATLGELGLTLGDIDLGSLDAEADSRLDEYFVTTSYVEHIGEGRDTLFLGRKGSGKSAVFKQLESLLRAQGFTSTRVVRLTPDQYTWSGLKRYQEQGLLAEQAHTNAWRLTLALQLAADVADAAVEWNADAERPIAELRAFLKENYGAGVTLNSAATSLVQGLKSLNLSAFGFGVGVERRESGETPITPAVTEALLERVKIAISQQGLLVALDRLDESWDGSAQSRSLLVGLLKATKDLNARFDLVPNDTGLRVLTFLRTDIYDGLEFDDKDKHRQTERRIVWSSEELRQMLQLRLPSGLFVDELFEPGEMRQRTTPFSYIVRRTYLRPREILQFIDACIKAAGKGASEISRQNIYDAEATYSGWKVEDLRQEFKSVYPHFARTLEALRQGVHRYPSIEELEAHLTGKQPELVSELGARALTEMLFETSVIGVRLRNSGSARFRTEDPYLALPSTGAVYVHHSLRKGLNITEARDANTEEED